MSFINQYEMNNYLTQLGVEEQNLKSIVASIFMYLRLKILEDGDFIRDTEGHLKEIKNILIRGKKVLPNKDTKRQSIKIIKKDENERNNVIVREILRN